LGWGAGAAYAVELAGGTNGAKLEVITCNEHITANGAVVCCREAVADKVAAVVGWPGFDAELNPVLHAAKIPALQWVISDFDQTQRGSGQWSIQYSLNGTEGVETWSPSETGLPGFACVTAGGLG
jgi:hypothetical protein